MLKFSTLTSSNGDPALWRLAALRWRHVQKWRSNQPLMTTGDCGVIGFDLRKKHAQMGESQYESGALLAASFS
jgi:hypothetical protein